jgi:prepilin-type N-terminal cleavage/methylation domain-containing protein/prepilin-type processing-associated H-X9-DG protein
MRTTSHHQSRGFTLIELLVVIAIIAILAAMLLPVLASAKAKAQRIQCTSQIKQLAMGITLFTLDNGEMYPPGGWQGVTTTMAWDCWINNYVGGHAPPGDMTGGVFISMDDPLAAAEAGALGFAVAPKLMTCPADRFGKVGWMAGPPQFATRSYAMNAAGGGYGPYVQVDDKGRTYPLPDLNQSGGHGVGMYWLDTVSTLPDWSAHSYKTSVVRDGSGTILLAENASGQGCAGNIWPCVCCGPQTSDGTAGGWGNLFQTDLRAPNNPNASLGGTQGYSQGFLLYRAHGLRFNYAFCDGHVETLKMEQTVGTGTLTNPKGMWTVTPGD